MFEYERAAMAARFVNSILLSPTLHVVHGATPEQIGDDIVDRSLRMADRIIAACTKPVAEPES